MKKSLFSLGLCLIQAIGISAQIKMVDETYKEQLSASNYVKEPLAIDNILKPYDGMSLQGFEDFNIVGDTLYTNGFKDFNSGILVNHKAKTMNVQLNVGLEVPKGYWRVTGLYLCRDAGCAEIADEIFALKDNGYEYVMGRSGDKPTKEFLKEEFSNLVYRNCWTLQQMNEWIQRRKLDGDNGPWSLSRINGLRLDCCPVYRLESVDSAYVCYMSLDHLRSGSFLPVSYYNLLCNELKGQEVFMSYGGARPVIPNYMVSSYKEFKDALNGNTVFQKDTLFTCVDVVVSKELRTICILEGKNTGRFAVFANSLVESNEERNCQNIYYTTSGEMTIWPYKDHQASKGHLVRDKHFAVGSSINSEDRIIIKMTDLNDIYGETAIYLDKKETQRQYEQERYQARMAKRKQELCSKYGNEYGTLIANRKVALGMTPEMCRLAWGYPTMISNLVDNTGTYTVCRYNFKTYIYFKDGKVAMILN